ARGEHRVGGPALLNATFVDKSWSIATTLCAALLTNLQGDPNVVRTAIVAALMLSACAVATPASADLPNAATLLADLGYTPDQVEKVQAGEFARGTIQSSGPRELVAA